MARILAVDPGDVRIGVAVSDPTGLVARPYKIIHHRSRALDAEAILAIASEFEVECIIVGVPYDLDGTEGPQARKAIRLVEQLRCQTNLPIKTWDESGSSKSAYALNGRSDKLDAIAAAAILRSFFEQKNRY